MFKYNEFNEGFDLANIIIEMLQKSGPTLSGTTKSCLVEVFRAATYSKSKMNFINKVIKT